MNAGKTSPVAPEYDQKIEITMPMYRLFHTETIDLIKSIHPAPGKWLDTGCGTGNLILSALKTFDCTKFVLADPSTEMINIVRKKLSCSRDRLDRRAQIELLPPVASENIGLPDWEFDIVTAIQVHHFLSPEERKRATGNCFRMLKPQGIYITFENIRPFSETGVAIGLARWKQYQITQGKSKEEAEKHIQRFDQEYFPINIKEHLLLLKEAGFSMAEVFWVSFMQAGFYAVK
ncbi:MAG: methyltransferase [Candidatus Dehalobacter alkaniphilus]|uniref:class I SAM-dependent methyltransferase n=1 Tax=Dehalobacter sp. DCM TaxID=2907827 RepID=UPI00308177DB|nr:class I SAM-dependent methyltransferase [Dehalobacter sp. DCM]